MILPFLRGMSGSQRGRKQNNWPQSRRSCLYSQRYRYRSLEPLESRLLLASDFVLDASLASMAGFHLKLASDGTFSTPVGADDANGAFTFQTPSTGGGNDGLRIGAGNDDVYVSGVSNINAVGASIRVQLSSYAASGRNQPAPTQLVIVDGAVPNYHELVQSIVNSGLVTYGSAGSSSVSIAAGARPVASSTTGPIVLASRYGDIEVVVLDTGHDGILQVSDILEPYHGLFAVHVLSHGGAGAMRLGSSVLNESKLDQDQALISTWGRALQPGGDILLYGCDIALGADGVGFVQNLAHATGADVAASTNSTGGMASGGDWKLEYSTGVIEAQDLFAAPALSTYGSLLNGESYEQVANAFVGKTVNTATIVTHGFQSSADDGDSLYSLADAIRTRIDSANGDNPVWFLDYDVSEEGQTGVFDAVQTTLPDAASDSGDVVLLFDWAPESNESSAGWGDAAGEALFTMLVGLGIVDPARGSENPALLHFIGHSFGTAVTSEAIERLARFQVPVDQVTYLDPHDFDQGIVPVDGQQKLFTLGLPSGYGATVWDNVEFADVYYQTEIPPDGRPIPGAFSTLVNDEVGGLMPHSRVWDEYYLNTVTDDTSTMGYAYSAIVREEAGQNAVARPVGNFYNGQDHQHSDIAIHHISPTEARLNTAATSDQLAPDDLVTGKWRPVWQPTTIANGTLKYGGDAHAPPTIKRNIAPGWSHHGGGGPAEIVEMSDGFLGIELTETGTWREHNRFYLASDIGELGFDAKVPVFSETTDLEVHLETADGRDVATHKWTVDLDSATVGPDGTFTEVIEIPNEHKGRVNTIRFELVSEMAPIAAEVQVHEVRLSPQTTIITGPFEIDGTQVLEYAGNVVFDATSEVTGKVDDIPDDLILDVQGTVTFLGQISGLRDLIVHATDKITVGRDMVGTDVLISTRKIALNGDVRTDESTGDSGDIKFKSDQIVLHPGAKLLTHAGERSVYSPGNIILEADDSAVREKTLISPLDVNENSAKVTIDGAEIWGGVVRITAEAVDTHVYDDLVHIRTNGRRVFTTC